MAHLLKQSQSFVSVRSVTLALTSESLTAKLKHHEWLKRYIIKVTKYETKGRSFYFHEAIAETRMTVK